jgi:hypothetical protein
MTNHRGLRFTSDELVFIAGSTRGWRVVCDKCGATETITTNKRLPLPPDQVMRKLMRTGWEIGRRPAHDRCGRCAHPRREQSPKPAAPPPLLSPTWPALRDRVQHCLAFLSPPTADPPKPAPAPAPQPPPAPQPAPPPQGIPQSALDRARASLGLTR